MRKIKFNKEKFKEGILGIKDQVGWARDIVYEFGIRKLIIKSIKIAVIISLFAGFFYWKGLKNAQPIMEIDYETEITVIAPKGYEYLDNLAFHKPPNSNKWDWIDSDIKTIYAKVKLGDIPESDKLKPYGFTNKIIGVMGLGISPNDISGESGVGYRYARLWSLRTEILATDKGFYPISVSYKPNWMFSNTSINIAGGKAWKDGLNRGFFGLNVEF